MWAQYALEQRTADKNWAPDLRSANLSSVDLSGAELRGANLARANLFGAILFRVNLAGANLSGAILVGADLRGANLARADLNHAHLRGANLARADLSGADLFGAVLVGADLRGANLDGVDLAPAQLGSSQLVVGIYADVGSRVDPQVIVDLVRAVGVLAHLAVAVGPRLHPERGLSGSGSTAVRTTTTEAQSHEIYFSSLAYYNPFSVELVEVMRVAIPLAVGVGVRPVVKDLLQGPDESGLVRTLATFMSRERRAAFFARLDAQIKRSRLEDEAASAEAEARILEIQAGMMVEVEPATERQLVERIHDATNDQQAAATLIEHLPALAALLSREHTLVFKDEPGRDQR